MHTHFKHNQVAYSHPRCMLYQISNRKSPISLGTRIGLLKLYLHYVDTNRCRSGMSSVYSRLSLVPSRSRTENRPQNSFWYSNLCQERVLLNQAGTNNIKDNIRTQTRLMFYNDSKSIYTHTQNIWQFSVDPRLPNNKVKPRTMTWSRKGYRLE